MKYLQRLEELKLTNQKHLPDLGDNNFEKIMYKIKCKVMKERMRLNEFFKDYDKLRTGRILKTLFPRAMDLSSLKLTKVEVEQLMERWVTREHKGKCHPFVLFVCLFVCFLSMTGAMGTRVFVRRSCGYTSSLITDYLKFSVKPSLSNKPSSSGKESFPINLHRCWSREWKRSIGSYSVNQSEVQGKYILRQRNEYRRPSLN